MTAALVAGGLLVLALLDGAFAGFRSGQGRDGRIRRGDRSARDHGRGALAMTVALAPVVVVACLDVARTADRVDAYERAGAAMLTLYAPYGLVVLIALAAYALLGWQHQLLASALILGPFTFLRPLVAVGGGGAAVLVAQDGRVAGLAVWAVVAVLLVEPSLNRWWRLRAPETALLG